MWESAIDRLAKEWAVIEQAPFSFIVALLIVGGTVWLTLEWRYGSIIAHRDSSISLKDTEISDYKRRLEGASPDEAAAYVADLKEQISALQPYRLSPTQMRDMQDKLRTISNGLHIVSEAGNPSVKILAAQLERVFMNAGWSPIIQGERLGGSKPQTGIGVVIGQGESLYEGREEIQGAFKAAGLMFDVLDSHPTVNDPMYPEIFLTSPDPKID